MLIRIPSNAIGTKRPASRDRSEGAVRQAHHRRKIERLSRQTKAFNAQSAESKASGDRTPAMEFEQIFSSQCNRTGGKSFRPAANLFTNDFSINSTQSLYFKEMVEPDGIEPTTSCLQSRRSPS